jgi:hypothetical protein
VPESEAGWRKLFEFARKMGIEAFISKAVPQSFEVVERLCKENAVNFALQTGTRPPSGGAPKDLLKLCQNRPPEIGVCATIGGATPASSDNPAAILKGRLLIARIGLPGPTGATIKSLCGDAQRLRLKPVFLIDPGSSDAAEVISRFDAACVNLR